MALLAWCRDQLQKAVFVGEQDRPDVANTLRLLDLPTSVQEMIRLGQSRPARAVRWWALPTAP